jgi:pimeloyl-ACP methyl ester carboxylesterase
METSNVMQYTTQGQGPVIIFLSGLFGKLSRWDKQIEEFSVDHQVIVPEFPIYNCPKEDLHVEKLALKYLRQFIEDLGLQNQKIDFVGNSMGGHVGLIYGINYPENVETLTLTGSSGLYEKPSLPIVNILGNRGSKSWIEEKVQEVFYDKALITQEMVDEVHRLANDRNAAVRLSRLAKSSQRHSVKKDLHKINFPVLCVWGMDDKITPVRKSGLPFKQLIKKCELAVLSQCSHVPPMDQWLKFNETLRGFLLKYSKSS